MSLLKLPFLFLGIGLLLAAAFYTVFGDRTTDILPDGNGNPTSSSSTNGDPSPATARVLAVGDIMIGRHVENLWKQNGEDYPFLGIRDTLLPYDVVIANLEGPIPDTHVQTPIMGFSFSFVSSTAKTMKRNGIDIVSLANNHTTNAGDAGFIATRKYLSEASILFFGNPVRETRDAVLATEINGVPFVFVGFNPTFPNFSLANASLLVKQVRQEFPNHFLVVEPHWGEEYQLVGNALQKQIAHAFIDNGADIVIGHHPHVVQHIERYNGKLIFYSLGNFIFDQYFSVDVQEGLMVEIVLDAKTRIPSFKLLPLDLGRSQPRLMPDTKKTEWLKALAARSDATLASQIATGVITQ